MKKRIGMPRRDIKERNRQRSVTTSLVAATFAGQLEVHSAHCPVYGAALQNQRLCLIGRNIPTTTTKCCWKQVHQSFEVAGAGHGGRVRSASHRALRVPYSVGRGD